jgi:hypothetical protein
MGRYYGIPRKDAESTGLPLYLSRKEVPVGLLAQTHCAKAKCPIGPDEKPVAHSLSRTNHGYIPLYKREGLNIKDFKWY